MLLTFYIGETQLFSSAVISKFSSIVYNDLSFVLIDSKCYLVNGYPSFDLIDYDKDKHKKQREENMQKNQLSWIWTNTRKGYWDIAGSPFVNRAINNDNLRKVGYLTLSDYYRKVTS